MATPLAPQTRYLVVGASGGRGLDDVRSLLKALPVALEAAVLVVLHRPSNCVSYLGEVLAQASSLPVQVAGDGERMLEGRCYIGDPRYHLTLGRAGRASLVDGFGHRYRNRTVDLLFASVAHNADGYVCGVILSGGLDDGARGLGDIARRGGRTLVLGLEGVAQAGMPHNAARCVAAAKVLDGPAIADQVLVDLVSRLA